MPFVELKKSVPVFIAFNLVKKMTQSFEKLISSIRMDVVETHGFMISGVNYEIVMLYWRIGRKIISEETALNFSLDGFIDRLRDELKNEPLYNKLSFESNDVKAMLALARNYPDDGYVEEVFTKLTWESISILILGVAQKYKRHWYARKAILADWTPDDLRQAIARLQYEARRRKPVSEFYVGLVG